MLLSVLGWIAGDRDSSCGFNESLFHPVFDSRFDRHSATIFNVSLVVLHVEMNLHVGIRPIEIGRVASSIMVWRHVIDRHRMVRKDRVRRREEDK